MEKRLEEVDFTWISNESDFTLTWMFLLTSLQDLPAQYVYG